MSEESNLVQCPDCEQGVSKKAEVCPHCGRRIRGSRTDQVATVLFVLIILGAIMELLSTVMNSAAR